jgi:hypothetical protein
MELIIHIVNKCDFVVQSSKKEHGKIIHISWVHCPENPTYSVFSGNTSICILTVATSK